ncbi:MAG: hypothetical protein J6B94_07340 [Lachnospiraceae bacterium]|nr:hypothetical protein [Lachnospiraceae bacterium]
MLKNKWSRLLTVILVICMAVGTGIFLYHDYYTLKEADLILFMGQSNMSGAGGNAEGAPELIKGAGYEYRAITQPEELCILSEPFGENEHKEGFLDDRELIPRGGSLVTAFVNAYYKETKQRVVAVSASRGSAQISSFNNYLVEDVIERLENAKRVMMEQQVNIRHIYMVWFQGETDAYLATTSDQYIGGMQQLLYTLQPYGVEKCFVIQIGNVIMGEEVIDTSYIQSVQENLCETDENFIMASTIAKTISEPPYMEDGIHFTQQGLNLIGEDAGRNTGNYIKTVVEGR